MIVGTPEAVEAAARDLGTAGTTLVETGETVGHHADTLDASWSGAASGAATRVVTGLARRIGAGGAPCSSVDAALIAYAQALRDAQREWAAANADAQAGENALTTAKADGAAARAMPVGQEIGPTGVNASNAAAQRATTARQSAQDSIDTARDAMADVVTKLAQANQAAADIVVTATEQLAEMAWSGAADGGPAAAIREGRARRADDARADSAQPDSFGDQVQNVVGGGGDGLWKVGPGVVGWGLGFIPWGVGDSIEGTVDGWHDDLEDWYGADTESAAYKGASGTVQVASLAIPGMGVVKVGRVIGAAKGAKALGVAGSAAKATGAVRAMPATAVAGARETLAGGARLARVLGSGAATTARSLKTQVLAPLTAKVSAADEIGSVAMGGNTGGPSAEEWRGIFHRIRDPTSAKSEQLRDAFALQSYEAVRTGDKIFDTTAIAESSGLRSDEVGQALEHVFKDEHLLEHPVREGDTIRQRFDPSADMYEAFERLEKGEGRPVDIALLKHELIESQHMRADPDLVYQKAHRLTIDQGYEWTEPKWKQFYEEG